MIERYATPDMSRIWSDQNKYETWKNVEIAVTEVLSDRGEVPKESEIDGGITDAQLQKDTKKAEI